MRYDLYVDSYRRYKRGTDKIAQWIAKAGRLCGAAVPTSTKGNYLMPLAKLRDLAETIATCKEPEIEVKADFLHLLEDVISQRKAAAIFFRHNSPANELSESSNDGHLYTIEVLEDVLALLRPLEKSEPTSSTTQQTDQKDKAAEQKPNIFDALEVEEISEPIVRQDLVLASKSSKGKGKWRSKTKPNDDAFELGSSTDELYFTLYCFYKDLHDVQAYLQEVWREYMAGGIPLTSAAVTTDLAFDVIKRKEEEVLQLEWMDPADGSQKTLRDVLAEMQKKRTTSAVPLYWTFDKQDSMLNHGYLGELVFEYISGLNGDKLPQGASTGEAVHDQMYRVAEWLYEPAYIMLDRSDAATGLSDANGGPLDVRKTKVGPEGSASVKSFEHSFVSLGQLILEFIQIRGVGFDEMIASDVWTTAMCDLVDPDKNEVKKRLGGRNNRQARHAIPVWLAFATTVYLDIRKLLGVTISRPYQELRNESIKSTKTINQMLKWCKDHPDVAWTKQYFGVVESIKKVLKMHVLDDPVAFINKTMDIPGGPTQTPHYLLRNNPLWAGIVTIWLQLTMWDVTIEMMNIYDITSLATHLYGLACTKEKVDWPDMEYLIELHGVGHLFYGGLPSNPEESSRKYMLSLGMSIQNGASNRHSKHKISSRGFANAVRQHRPHCIRTDLLNFRYGAVRMRAGPAEGPQKNLPALDLLLEFQKRMPNEMLVTKGDSSAYLVPLLSLVHKAVAKDDQHLQFDYFQMHLRCWSLLERLHGELHEELATIGGVTGQRLLGTDQMTLRHMISNVFMAIPALLKSGNAVNRNKLMLAKMVLKTADAVRAIAQEKGSAGLDLVSQAKGMIDEEVDPAASMSSDVSSDTDDSDVDLDQLEMLTAALSLAPERTVTDEQAKEVLRQVKKTPFNKMPPATQEYFKSLQASNGGRNPLQGGMEGLFAASMKQVEKFTPEQQERFLQTKTLEEANKLKEVFAQENAARVVEVDVEKKKRNNKNKNKNRKLRLKEEKAAMAENGGVVAGPNSTKSKATANNGDASSSSSSTVTSRIPSVTSRGPDLATYQEGKRQGKMMIDGEEFTLSGSTQMSSDPKDLSEGQLDNLLDMLTRRM